MIKYVVVVVPVSLFERKKTEKIDCPPKNENVPHNFNQGDKLSPSDQILAQTLAVCSFFVCSGQAFSFLVCTMTFCLQY